MTRYVSSMQTENSSNLVSANVPSHSWLPDEVSAAIDTLQRATADAVTGYGMRARYASFYLNLFAGGCWVGLGLYEMQLVNFSAANLWRALLTILSFLSGFIITAMLFTGKTEVAKSLSLEQLNTFFKKSNHLLISQLCTLGSNFFGLLLIGVISAISKDSIPFTEPLIILAFGFVTISVFRSFLIPVQIIELHRFVQTALMTEKRIEEEEKANTL